MDENAAERKRKVIFIIGCAVLIIIVGLLAFFGTDQGKKKAENDAARNPVGISANGPDAQAEADSEPTPTAPESVPDVPTDNIDEAPQTVLSAEDQDAASKVAIDGTSAYYTVFSSENVQQYHQRVDPYFSVGNPALEDIPAADTNTTPGDPTNEFKYDSEVTLNYSNPQNTTANSLDMLLSITIKNQIIDPSTPGRPQIFQNNEDVYVTVTRGSDGIWRITNLNEE